MPKRLSKYPKEMVGKKINYFKIIKFVPAVNLNGKRITKASFVCICDCGETITRDIYKILKEQKSCGCYSTKQKMRTDNKFRTHGMTKTKVYRTWQTMRKRCSRPGYKYYSEIGVKVCVRWEKAFKNFFSDMGNPPSPDHSIDRINPFGNYSPKNCRWATRNEQQQNRRCSKQWKSRA